MIFASYCGKSKQNLRLPAAADCSWYIESRIPLLTRDLKFIYIKKLKQRPEVTLRFLFIYIEIKLRLAVEIVAVASPANGHSC